MATAWSTTHTHIHTYTHTHMHTHTHIHTYTRPYPNPLNTHVNTHVTYPSQHTPRRVGIHCGRKSTRSTVNKARVCVCSQHLVVFYVLCVVCCVLCVVCCGLWAVCVCLCRGWDCVLPRTVSQLSLSLSPSAHNVHIHNSLCHEHRQHIMFIYTILSVTNTASGSYVPEAAPFFLV